MKLGDIGQSAAIGMLGLDDGLRPEKLGALAKGISLDTTTRVGGFEILA